MKHLSMSLDNGICILWWNSVSTWPVYSTLYTIVSIIDCTVYYCIYHWLYCILLYLSFTVLYTIVSIIDCTVYYCIYHWLYCILLYLSFTVLYTIVSIIDCTVCEQTLGETHKPNTCLWFRLVKWKQVTRMTTDSWHLARWQKAHNSYPYSMGKVTHWSMHWHKVILCHWSRYRQSCGWKPWVRHRFGHTSPMIHPNSFTLPWHIGHILSSRLPDGIDTLLLIHIHTATNTHTHCY